MPGLASEMVPLLESGHCVRTHAHCTVNSWTCAVRSHKTLSKVQGRDDVNGVICSVVPLFVDQKPPWLRLDVSSLF